MPQVTAAQELQLKAQMRLASLMEEKLVTRISVLSTLLGGGKTTERLLVRDKPGVVLVGQKEAVAIAVRNASGRRRWSKLAEWLRPCSPVSRRMGAAG